MPTGEFLVLLPWIDVDASNRRILVLAAMIVALLTPFFATTIL